MGYFTPEVGTKSTRTEPEPAEDPSLHGVFFSGGVLQPE